MEHNNQLYYYTDDYISGDDCVMDAGIVNMKEMLPNSVAADMPMRIIEA